MRSYRDNVAGGKMTFGRGFLVGLGIALVAAVCYGVIWAVVYANFMPDFCDKYTAYMIDKVKASGGSAEKIAEATAQGAQMKRLMDNPADQRRHGLPRALPHRTPRLAHLRRHPAPQAASA